MNIIYFFKVLHLCLIYRRNMFGNVLDYKLAYDETIQRKKTYPEFSETKAEFLVALYINKIITIDAVKDNELVHIPKVNLETALVELLTSDRILRLKTIWAESDVDFILRILNNITVDGKVVNAIRNLVEKEGGSNRIDTFTTIFFDGSYRKYAVANRNLSFIVYGK